jgi:WD40 repeat protein
LPYYFAVSGAPKSIPWNGRYAVCHKMFRANFKFGNMKPALRRRRELICLGLIIGLAIAGSISGPRTSHAQEFQPQLVIQQGHASNPVHFAFAEGVQVFASAEDDGMVKIWDSASGELLQTLSGTDFLMSLAFSPDGARLAIGRNSSIEIWDWRQGTLIQRLGPLYARVVGLTWSPDGGSLAGCDGQATIWDVSTGRVIRTLGQRQDFAIHSLVFSADGQRVATGGERLQLWNLKTGSRERVLSWEGASSLAFLPDGQGLVSTRGADLWLWRLSDGKLLRLPDESNDAMGAVQLSGDGRVAIGSWKGASIAVYEIQSAKPPRLLRGASANWSTGFPPMDTAKLSQNGSLAVLSPRDGGGNVEIWDVKSGKRRFSLPPGVEETNMPVLSRDGKILVVAIADQLVTWDFEHNFREWDASGRSRTARWLGFGAGDRTLLRQILTPEGKGCLEAVDFTADGPALREIELPRGFEPLAWAPNGPILVGSVGTGKMGIFSAASGQLEVFDLKPGQSPFAFCPTKDLVALAGVTPQLLNYRTGEVLDLPEYQPGGIVASAFSPDGSLFGVRSHDSGAVSLWETASGKLLRKLPRTGPTHGGFLFSPNGNLIALLERGRMAVYDVGTGAEVFGVPAPRGAQLQFSGSGKTLLLSTFGGATEFWDLEKKKLRATLQLLPPLVARETSKRANAWVLYTPEGYYIGSPGSADAIRWRVGKQYLPAAAYAPVYNKPDLVLGALREK